MRPATRLKINGVFMGANPHKAHAPTARWRFDRHGADQRGVGVQLRIRNPLGGNRMIRRDQSAIVDEERWLKELDASIDESLQEMKAGGGHDLDEVCDAIIADIQATSGEARQ